jgi:hypothetical protein
VFAVVLLEVPVLLSAAGRVLLYIGAANYLSRVWMNGQAAMLQKIDCLRGTSRWILTDFRSRC